MPHLQKLYAQSKNGGLEVIAVNVADPKESVQQCLQEFKLTYPVGLDSEEDLEKPASYGVAQKYRVTGFPTLYVLDGSGRVAFRATGLHFKELGLTLKRLGVR